MVRAPFSSLFLILLGAPALGQDAVADVDAPLAQPEGCEAVQFDIGGACLDGPTTVVIAATPYTVGSPKSEPGRAASEKAFTGELSADFSLMTTEVTQAWYTAVMGDEPTATCAPESVGAARPVLCVSWSDAIQFANALSERMDIAPAYVVDGGEVRWDRESKGWRLPTDVEWEVAARAAGPTIYAGSDNPDLVAWYGMRVSGAQDVAQLRPNAAGISDLSGNAAEWVWDAWDLKTLRKEQIADEGADRIVRGGSWGDDEDMIRSASRSHLLRSTTDPWVGFRLARTR